MTTPNPSEVFGRHLSAAKTAPKPFEQDGSVASTPDIETAEVSETTLVTKSPVYPDDELTQTRRTDYQLGNPELPIANYREQIVTAVENSQAVVITAETGAGKSTQVPQMLAEAGYEVIVTQPRVVAARSVAERVNDEVVAKKGPNYDKFVGYRTAKERGDNPDNQILFATDGLQLVRELSGNGVGKKQVLVLDEVHEWNENMEVLVAWAKQRIAEDPNFKVVTMSATIEAQKLSHFLSNDGARQVPVIEVPGRTFEVKKSEGGDVADEAIKFAKAGKNTLVFVPGKQEIDDVVAQLTRANIPGATILPLHGQLEKADQRKVFAKYPGVKVIVATNVAQTSITIDDIDAVVDSGLERQNQVKNGVEGLYLNAISQADCLQRAGRAGRTKEGEYVLAQLGNNSFVPMAERAVYGTPEIMRTRLDGMVLRLAKSGFDAETMEFYHQPDKGQIVQAKQRLQKLGALTEVGTVTKIGRDMDRMPVESHYARMMIEARKYGPEIQAQLAALLAVQEADGICQFSTRNRTCQERWRGILTPNMNDSDAIKQLEVFVAAQTMSDSQKRDHDLYIKAFSKACEVMRQLRKVEKLQDWELTAPTKQQREALVKCIIAGMVDTLFTQRMGEYYDVHGDVREPSSRSTVVPGDMIVGSPFDLQITTRRGLATLRLIEGVTNVPSVEVLQEVAPQLFGEKRAAFIEESDGTIKEQVVVTFSGQALDKKLIRTAEPSPERYKYIMDRAVWASQEIYRPLVNELNKLRDLVPSIPEITNVDIRQMLVEANIPETVQTVGEACRYLPQLTLDNFMPAEEREVILQANPDSIAGVPVSYSNGYGYVSDTASPEDIIRVYQQAYLRTQSCAVPLMAVDVQDTRNNYVDLNEAAKNAQAQIVKDQERAQNAELDRQGAEQGLPSNVEFRQRIVGATGNSNAWVIRPDGTLREGDSHPTMWRQIHPGEIVLSWTKDDVISPHYFHVEFIPPEGISAEQIAAARQIQEELSKKWAHYDDRRFDSRGDRSSPPVGAGWGLTPDYTERQAEQKQLQDELYDILRTLHDLHDDTLSKKLQEEKKRMAMRIYHLLDTNGVGGFDYVNSLRSALGVAKKLLEESTAYQESQTTPGVVSADQLAELAKRFNGA